MHESPSPAALERLIAVGRRWRIYVPFAIVTPLVVFVLTSSQPRTYSASAEVLLSPQGLVISGLQDATSLTPFRTIRTQARIARLPQVAERVVAAAELGNRSPFAFLGRSSVTADGQTDLMTFSVRAASPEVASALATLYAEQYVAYRRALDTRSLRDAIKVLNTQARRARTQGEDPRIYADVLERQQRLHTALASVAANAVLVRPAGDATRIGPHPLRESLVALVLGLVVGLGLAALANLLDGRARSADEISDQLELPVLGRLPRVPARQLRTARTPVARRDAIAALRTSFDLDRVREGHGIVMVTSSVAGEGKSTTVAQLSLALAQAGRDVVLVDLDLRRPAVARLFGLPHGPGIVEVVRGYATVEQVARDRAFPAHGPPTRPGSADDGRTGRLRVVPAGASRGDSTDAFSGAAIRAALESLRELADVVLVDGPPLIQASDALALTSCMDGIVFVANMRTYRRAYAREIKRLLAISPAHTVGLIVIGEPRDLESRHGRTYREGRDRHRTFRELGPA